MALGDRTEGPLIGLSGAGLSTEGLITGLFVGLSGAGGDFVFGTAGTYYLFQIRRPRNGYDYQVRSFVDSLLPGHPYTVYDNYRYARDYLNNTNQTWSDVVYPSRAFGGAGGSIGSYAADMVNYVSGNVTRLYRSKHFVD